MSFLKITNDLGRINRADTVYKTYVNSELSVVYLTLLTGSVGICTLGLLLGYAPVVIGGMLISPLIWPLMKTSVGIASGRAAYIKQALFLLIISTVLSIFIAAFITYFSPIKFLNNEIISRTNPTLLDIVVALAAGGIAALALTQPRISESVAGVAIATSLLPPLCVSGIGLALFNRTVSFRGVLLFFSSAVSIIFTATLVFIILKVKQNPEKDVQRKGVVYTFVLLVLSSLPLFIFLKQYSFKTLAYNNIQETLEQTLANISPAIHLDNFKVVIPATNKEPVSVEASILIPEEMKLDYAQQHKIKSAIEKAIGREVNISLRVQNTISIISEKDKEVEDTKRVLRDTFVAEIKDIDPSLSVSSLDIQKDAETNSWKLSSVIRSDPDFTFSIYQKETLELALKEKTNQEVSLSLEFIPRILIDEKPPEGL